MFNRHSREELARLLRDVDAEIAAHPLSSPEVTAAQAVIDEQGANDTGAIEKELLAQGLPSLEALGRLQLTGTGSLWKLHRRRNALERKTKRLEA